jgi:hypothetical protein
MGWRRLSLRARSRAAVARPAPRRRRRQATVAAEPTREGEPSWSRATPPAGPHRPLAWLAHLQAPRYSAVWVATALLFAFSPLIASNSLGAFLGALLLTEVVAAVPFLQAALSWNDWAPGILVLVGAGIYSRARGDSRTLLGAGEA